MLRKWYALVLGLAFTVAQAGDIHTVSRVVFSPDSRHVLAVVEGYHDGSGFPFAEFTVLDTRTGRRLWQARQHPQAEGDLAQLREQWWRTYWPQAQRRFGFGPATLSRPRYQLPAPDIVPAGSGWGQTQVKVRLWTKPVPVVIKQSASGEKCPEWVYWKPQAYALYVGSQKLAAGKWNCASGYSVSRVDVKGNRVLVAVNAFTAGFEGPNNEQILVAATLN